MNAARRWRAPGGALVVALAAAIAAVPFVAPLVGPAGDPGRIEIIAWVGWAVCALLGGVALLHAMTTSTWLGPRLSAPSATVAIAFDALPVLLGGAWVVLVVSVATTHWLLASVAAAIAAEHLRIVVPRLWRSAPPRWSAGAPQMRVCVANVFIDNETPEQAAHALLATEADVIVVVESTPAFITCLDAAGGAAAYPHRVADPSDDSDYAVTVLSKHALQDGSGPERLGPLRAMRAIVPVADREVDVVAVNPMATVDPGGYSTWRRQMRELRHAVARHPGPLLVAGDLNTSRYRPEFARLLALGLRDAHDTLGVGLRPSFKLAARGLLGKLPPVTRLDHALTNRELHPIGVVDLEPNGSDHVPFVVTLAVRPSGPRGGRRRAPGRRSPHHPTDGSGTDPERRPAAGANV